MTRIICALLFTATLALAAGNFPLIERTAPLSLDSLYEIGYRYNSTVKRAEQDTRLNSIGKIAAIGNFLPSVSVGANFSESHRLTKTYVDDDGSVRTYPVVIDSVTIDEQESESRSSSQRLSADLLIFDGLKRYYLYKMAKNQEKIYNLTVGDSKKALARTIASQAVIVLTQQKLLDLSKKLRDQRQDAYDLAKARFDVGAVTELDVLQAQIELGRAQNDITSTERALATAREQLNLTLGIDLRSSFPVAEPGDPTPFEFNLDSLIAIAYEYRTDLAIADLSADQARYNLNHSRQDYLPTASLGATWSSDEQSGTTESWTLSPRNRNTTYSLSLNWNLFDGFARELSVAERRVAANKAYEQSRELRLSLEKDVRQSYYDLENSFNQLSVTSRNRELAQRTLDLERERYRLGATSQLSLRDAQVTYAQAETDHISKILEYQSNLIGLELAVGKELR